MARMAPDSKSPARRTWPLSALWSAVAIGLLLTFAVVINIIVGRTIHWDIVAGLGIAGFIALTLGRQFQKI
jgi:hypothetical protein